MYAILLSILISSAYGYPTSHQYHECLEEIERVYANLRIPPEEIKDKQAVTNDVMSRVDPEKCSDVQLELVLVNGKLTIADPGQNNESPNQEAPGSNEGLERNPGDTAEDQEIHRNSRRLPGHRHYTINHNPGVYPGPSPDYPIPPNEAPTQYDGINPLRPNDSQGPGNNDPSQQNIDPSQYPQNPNGGDSGFNNNYLIPDQNLEPDNRVPEQIGPANLPDSNNINPQEIPGPISNQLPENNPINSGNNLLNTPNNINSVYNAKETNFQAIDQTQRVENTRTSVIKDKTIDSTYTVEIQEEKLRQKQAVAQEFSGYVTKFFSPTNNGESIFSHICSVVEKWFKSYISEFSNFLVSGGLTSLFTTAIPVLGGLAHGLPSGIPSVPGVPSGIPNVGEISSGASSVAGLASGVSGAGGLASAIPGAGGLSTGVLPDGTINSVIP